MTEGLWAAVIGVGGTILGTVLGFVLGKIDFGRLRIEFKKGSEAAEYDQESRTAPQKLSSIDCSIIISLYNGANRNRVFRDAKIIFLDDSKNEVLTLSLFDLKTGRWEAQLYFIDKISVVNIPPKTGIDIKAKFSSREIDKLLKAKYAYIQYTNEKFEAQRKFLWECNYSKLLKAEEEDNG